jgi:hypothetical protein
MGTCAPGLYCDSSWGSGGAYSQSPPSYTCLSYVTAGEYCAPFSDNLNPRCALDLLCIAVNGTTGTCLPPNSLSNGDTFFIPSVNSFFVAVSGIAYCASGLAVPVANASTGYPAPYGRCVAEYDLTGAGEPCNQCAWSSDSPTSFNGKPITSLPIYGDGSLVCAPTTMNSSSYPCVLLPSSIASARYMNYASSYTQCHRRGRLGPTGAPCNPNLNGNDGSCIRFACFGSDLTYFSSLLSGGMLTYIDPLWARYSPDLISTSTSSSCRDDDALIAYMGQMDYTAACGLPPAFTEVGWSCPLPPSPSPSPGPGAAASPSAPPTPGQSASRTPTPSVTPLPGLAVVQVGRWKNRLGVVEPDRFRHV